MRQNSSKCIKMHQNAFWNIFHFDTFWSILMYFDAFWSILIHFDAFWYIFDAFRETFSFREKTFLWNIFISWKFSLSCKAFISVNIFHFIDISEVYYIPLSLIRIAGHYITSTAHACRGCAPSKKIDCVLGTSLPPAPSRRGPRRRRRRRRWIDRPPCLGIRE